MSRWTVLGACWSRGKEDETGTGRVRRSAFRKHRLPRDYSRGIGFGEKWEGGERWRALNGHGSTRVIISTGRVPVSLLRDLGSRPQHRTNDRLSSLRGRVRIVLSSTHVFGSFLPPSSSAAPYPAWCQASHSTDTARSYQGMRRKGGRWYVGFGYGAFSLSW